MERKLCHLQLFVEALLEPPGAATTPPAALAEARAAAAAATVRLDQSQHGSHWQRRRNDATELAHADMTALPAGGHQLHRTAVSDANNNW